MAKESFQRAVAQFRIFVRKLDPARSNPVSVNLIWLDDIMAIVMGMDQQLRNLEMTWPEKDKAVLDSVEVFEILRETTSSLCDLLAEFEQHWVPAKRLIPEHPEPYRLCMHLRSYCDSAPSELHRASRYGRLVELFETGARLYALSKVLQMLAEPRA